MTFYIFKTLVWVNQKKQRSLHTYYSFFLIHFQFLINAIINDRVR